MRKWYFILRIIAYISSFSALALIVSARTMDLAPRLTELMKAGSAVCFITGFTAFLATYSIYMYSRFFKQ